MKVEKQRNITITRIVALLIMLTTFLTSINAQKNSSAADIHSIDNRFAKENIGFKKASIHNSTDAIQFLKKEINNLSDPSCSLELINETKSKTGKHYLFKQTIFGYPIYRADVKINTDNTGNITSIFDHSFSVSTPPLLDFPLDTIASVFLKNYSLIDNYKISRLYFQSENDFIPSIRLEVTTNNDISEEVIFNASGNIIYKRDLNAYFQQVMDTTAVAKVFLPDPLTSGNYTYGNPIIDSNDVSYTTINNQLFSKNIKVNYQSGQFTLENSIVKIQEHSAPAVNPATTSNAIFNFNRNEDGFEDVNALYHITAFQQYLQQQLGVFDAANFQIAVDTHGLNGTDNSVFTSSSTPPRLTFGEGGVDDAEDADVIIHEYGHAISYSCAPNTNNGTQRKALDEGLGDYFASSYSRMLNTYNWHNVFSWDGHNEYWGGRIANSTMRYPNNLTNQIHTDGQIWSSVLMEIWNNLGPDTTTAILIEALHSFSSNMSMSAAASLYIQADSNLYNGAHYTTICTYFYDRGLVNSCESFLGLSKSKMDANKEWFYPNPTMGIVITEQNYSNIFIFDIVGRIVYSSDNNYHDLSFLDDGCYVITGLKNDKIISRKKIIISK